MLIIHYEKTDSPYTLYSGVFFFNNIHHTLKKEILLSLRLQYSKRGNPVRTPQNSVDCKKMHTGFFVVFFILCVNIEQQENILCITLYKLFIFKDVHLTFLVNKYLQINILQKNNLSHRIQMSMTFRKQILMYIYLPSL